MPTGNLPSDGKALFEKVYNGALKGSCKGDKECAARTAWSAVKGAGWHKNADGDWVKGKSDVFQEFSMAISKVSFDKQTQERRITMVASDTDPDLSGEKMSVHLFQDFISRIEQGNEVPEAFRSAICEDGWCGGRPYISISHYKSGAGRNVPGEITVSYLDADKFKSKAVLHDTPLGKAVFKSLNDDLTGKSEFDDKVRVSIGFLDLAHKHGDFLFERTSIEDVCPKCADGEGDKEYYEGVLVHEAFTRKPMNPRTDVEVQKMDILTRRDDAESIVGDEVLDEMDLTAKSELVVERSKHEYDEMDMEQHAQKVRHAFYMKFDPPQPVNPSPYVHSISMSHVVASHEGKLYKVGYSNDGEEIKFDAQKDWQEVQLGFIPVKSELDDEIIWRAATKSEGDCNHPASHYLVHEDESKPTTWHLRYKDCSGKINTRLLGAAKAALTVGYRGNKYAGPGKAEALSKLKKLYESAGLEWKADTEEEIMPDEIEQVVEEPVEETPAADAPVEQAPEETTPPAVVESAVDRAVGILRSKIAEFKAAGVTGDAALKEIQPFFNELGVAVKGELASPIEISNAGIADVMRTVLREEVGQEIAVMKARITQLEVRGNIDARPQDVPVVSRSLVVRPTAQQPLANGQGLKIADIARRSVG